MNVLAIIVWIVIRAIIGGACVCSTVIILGWPIMANLVYLEESKYYIALLIVVCVITFISAVMYAALMNMVAHLIRKIR